MKKKIMEIARAMLVSALIVGFFFPSTAFAKSNVNEYRNKTYDTKEEVEALEDKLVEDGYNDYEFVDETASTAQECWSITENEQEVIHISYMHYGETDIEENTGTEVTEDVAKITTDESGSKGTLTAYKTATKKLKVIAT